MQSPKFTSLNHRRCLLMLVVAARVTAQRHHKHTVQSVVCIEMNLNSSSTATPHQHYTNCALCRVPVSWPVTHGLCLQFGGLAEEPVRWEYKVPLVLGSLRKVSYHSFPQLQSKRTNAVSLPHRSWSCGFGASLGKLELMLRWSWRPCFGWQDGKRCLQLQMFDLPH